MDRKRIMRLATGLLLVGMIFFVGRTCQAEHADITVVFENGGEQTVERFEASILRADEVVASFSAATVRAGQDRRWKLDLDPGSYTLELELTIAGKTERSRRRLEAIARATIRVALEPLPSAESSSPPARSAD